MAATAAATLALLSPAAVRAQAAGYPNKAIKLVVPYAPGGSADIAARLVTDEWGKALGGSLYSDAFCDSHPGQLRDCVHTTSCSIRGLWLSVESAVRGVLDNVTLADLSRSPVQRVSHIEMAPR